MTHVCDKASWLSRRSSLMIFVAIIGWQLILGRVRAASAQRDADAMLAQGNESTRTGQFAAAVNWYSQAADAYGAKSLVTEQCLANSAQAAALCRMGRYPEAIPLLRAAVSIAPSGDRHLSPCSRCSSPKC